MTTDEIKNVIIGIVTDIQTQSLRDVPVLHGGSRLIGDVQGCDSLIVSQIAMDLSEQLGPLLNGRDIPEYILLGRQRCRPTLDQIAQDVSEFVQRGQKKGRSPKGSAATNNYSMASSSSLSSSSASSSSGLPSTDSTVDGCSSETPNPDDSCVGTNGICVVEVAADVIPDTLVAENENQVKSNEQERLFSQDHTSNGTRINGNLQQSGTS